MPAQPMSDKPADTNPSAPAAEKPKTAQELTIIPLELLGLANDDETGVYDTIEIEDMELDEEREAYVYPCPCGDKFFISLSDLQAGEDIATCPSCSLRIKVVYNHEDFVDYEDE